MSRKRLTGKKRSRPEDEEPSYAVPFLAYVDKRRDSHRSWSEKLDYILVYVVARVIVQMGAEFVLYEQKKSRKNTGIWVEVARFVSEYRDRKTNGAKKEGKHCRERFLNNLSPILSSSEWSSFENRIILEFKYFVNCDSPWSELRVIFGNQRCGNEIKNHYNLRLKKLVEKPKKSSQGGKKGNRSNRDQPLKSRYRNRNDLEAIHDLEVVHHSNSKDGTKNKKRSVSFQVDFGGKRRKMYREYKSDTEVLTVIPRSSQKPLVRMGGRGRGREGMYDEDEEEEVSDADEDFPEEWTKKNYYSYTELNELHRKNLVEWARVIILRHHKVLLANPRTLKWFREKLSDLLQPMDMERWTGPFDQTFWESLQAEPILSNGGSAPTKIAPNRRKKKSSVQNRTYEPPSPVSATRNNQIRVTRRRKARLQNKQQHLHQHQKKKVIKATTNIVRVQPPPPPTSGVLSMSIPNQQYDRMRVPSPPSTTSNRHHLPRNRVMGMNNPVRMVYTKEEQQIVTENYEYQVDQFDFLFPHHHNNQNQFQPKIIIEQQEEEESSDEEEEEEDNIYQTNVMLPPFYEDQPFLHPRSTTTKKKKKKVSNPFVVPGHHQDGVFPKYTNLPSNFPSAVLCSHQKASPPQHIPRNLFVVPRTIYIPPPANQHVSASPPSSDSGGSQVYYPPPPPPPTQQKVTYHHHPPTPAVIEHQKSGPLFPVAREYENDMFPTINLFDGEQASMLFTQQEEDEDDERKEEEVEEEDVMRSNMEFSSFGELFQKFNDHNDNGLMMNDETTDLEEKYGGMEVGLDHRSFVTSMIEDNPLGFFGL